MDIGTAKDYIEDLQQEVHALTRDRDEWRRIAEQALEQIDAWKAVCLLWEKRYNDSITRNN